MLYLASPGIEPFKGNERKWLIYFSCYAKTVSFYDFNLVAVAVHMAVKEFCRTIASKSKLPTFVHRVISADFEILPIHSISRQVNAEFLPHKQFLQPSINTVHISIGYKLIKRNVDLLTIGLRIQLYAETDF